MYLRYLAGREIRRPFCSYLYRTSGSGRKAGTYQVVKDTLVELPLGWAALPKLLVVVIKARPVFAELRETVLVDVLDAKI